MERISSCCQWPDIIVFIFADNAVDYKSEAECH